MDLRVWHPECWTLQVTEDTHGGIVSDGVYQVGSDVMAHIMVYGDTNREVSSLKGSIEDSPLTTKVRGMEKRFKIAGDTGPPGNAVRELLVTYEPGNSIHDPLVSHGFIPVEPIRVKDGYEQWTVLAERNRQEISGLLAEIEEWEDAEIEVTRIETIREASNAKGVSDGLSERQREVFELARASGYYAWPREVSAKDLSNELGISETTVLEHLRKAESALLG